MYTEVAMQIPVRDWKTVIGNVDYDSIKPEGNGLLDRLCVLIGKWFLKRGGAFTSKTTWDTIGSTLLRIDPDKIAEGVLKAHRTIEDVWYKECSVIACGPEEYYHWNDKLLDSVGPAEYQAQAHLSMRGNTRVCGLRVVVVPWMKGAVLLPKEVFGK